MGYLLGQVEMFTKVIMMLIWDMVFGKCIGMVEAFIKVNGSKDFNMVRDRYMCQAKVLKGIFKIISL